MKKITFLLISTFVLFCSCKKEIDIPAYIQINSTVFNTKTGEGTPAQQIDHVGIYVDDQLFGIYEIPISAPIEQFGNHRVDIRPFIKRNAYDGYIINSLFTVYSVNMDLVSGQTQTILPEFGYRTDVNFKYLEDFNDNLSSFEIKERYNKEDTFFIENNMAASFDSTPYMRIDLKQGDSKIVISTQEEFQLPLDGRETYLELHYKCNASFTIGIVSRDPNQIIYLPLVAPFVTNGEWKKGYIALRDELASLGNQNILGIKLFFGLLNAEDNLKPEILIDNLKIVYRD